MMISKPVSSDNSKVVGEIVPDDFPSSYNKNSNNGGGGSMNNDYVTHPELKISESKTQAELEKINTKLDAKFEVINHRLDNLDKNIPMMIENALLKERDYQRDQQKENRRFFWGTIIIGGISAIAGVVSVLVSLL